MSQQNLDLVLGLYPGPTLDLATVSRDEKLADQVFAEWVSRLRPDCECVVVDVPEGERTACTGLEEIKAFWLRWLAPWEMFRAAVDEAIDCGKKVVVLHHVFGRPKGGTSVVQFTGTDVWTIRDGRIARVEFHARREEGLRAAGLEA